MKVKKCRVCGNELFVGPLLRYENMPMAAQFLPGIGSLKTDKGITLEIFQCSGCGLVQSSNAPVSYYREAIRATAISGEMKVLRMKQFSDFIKKFSLKGKKVIEIGCGRGEHLCLMQQLNIKAYGLEYSKRSVSQCINNGLRVAQGFIQDSTYKLRHAPFDAFLILNFLEHLPSPISSLRGVYNNLADGAIGLVEVPDFAMTLRNKLFFDFIGDHIFYFTKDTLRTTMELSGFEIIECQEMWHKYIISAIVKKRKKISLLHFDKYKNNIENKIVEYIHRFEDKQVAIWGAGHQALAIISLLDLSDKIKYVVDSSVLKQGKYTPATHVKIVSPDLLNFDPPDAVIVIAAGYSDEIVRTVRRKFDKNIHISILRDRGLEILK